MSSMAVIEDFLEQKRIAVVGVSRNPKDLSRTLVKTLRQRGYEAFAVNPGMSSADDAPCYASLKEIPSTLDGVIVMTSPAVTGEVVQECAAHSARVALPRWGTRCGEPASARILPRPRHKGRPWRVSVHVFFRGTLDPSAARICQAGYGSVPGLEASVPD